MVFNLVTHQDPQVLFLQSCFSRPLTFDVLVPGVVPPQVQDLALPLVELHEVTASPFLQLVRVLPACGGPTGLQHDSLVYQPLLPIFCHPTNLCFAPIICNKWRCRTDWSQYWFWCTLVVTGFQLAFMPLIIQCSASCQCSSPFAQPTHTSSACLWGCYGKHCQSLAQVNMHSICCSPVIHQTVDFIAEGYWVGQVWFPLCESLLTSLSPPCLSHAWE